MIEELLEKRQVLFDIAEILYGEYWIMEEKFWNSKTQKELNKITLELEDMGYDFEHTVEQLDDAHLIMEYLEKIIKNNDGK